MKKITSNHQFKKKYGQNFLIDEYILTKIVNKANIREETLVLEVGVGSANLTKRLLMLQNM